MATPLGDLYNRIEEFKEMLAREGTAMSPRKWSETVTALVACLIQYKALIEEENYDLLMTTLHQEDEIERLTKLVEAFSN